jgi:hypothetical protein
MRRENNSSHNQSSESLQETTPTRVAAHSSYTIYLLTVWFDSMGNASDPASWRFRLENPRTKEARGFVGVEALAKGVSEMIGESIR